MAGVIDNGVGLGDARAWALEDPPFAAQRLALGTAVFIGLFIPFEVAAG